MAAIATTPPTAPPTIPPIGNGEGPTEVELVIAEVVTIRIGEDALAGVDVRVGTDDLFINN